jgi:hypothetical protein
MSKKQIVLMAAACLLLVGQASWAAVAVGTCRPSLISFTTIQAAVNAVPAGGTVYVCPGTYPEQVAISKKLTVTGISYGGGNAAVILPPGGGLVANATSLATGNPIAAQIWVHDVNLTTMGAVNISNLIVDGTGNNIASCSPNPMGILYQNASGTIAHVVARNQSPEPYSQYGGCQTGLGIFVQSGPTGAGTTSTVTVSGSTVHNYAKNGITGNEVGTTLNATGNSVVGVGPTTGAAQNGIQIGFGATGKMTSNSVADDVWAPDTINDAGDAASGLLVYASPNVTISGNSVANTQFGIAIATDPSETTAGGGNTITSNKVSGTHIFDGIDVCTDTNTVKSNTINSSDEAGIHVDSSCGGGNTSNIVQYNTINEACAGLLVGNSSGGTIGPNIFFNVNTAVQIGTDVCNAPVFNANFAAVSTQTAHGAFVPARP